MKHVKDKILTGKLKAGKSIGGQRRNKHNPGDYAYSIEDAVEKIHRKIPFSPGSIEITPARVIYQKTHIFKDRLLSLKS